MRYFNVAGTDRPLLLSDEHAELIGATEVSTRAVRPNKAAAKSEWVDYAVGTGADPTVAESMTRADLIARYGG